MLYWLGRMSGEAAEMGVADERLTRNMSRSSERLVCAWERTVSLGDRERRGRL
jgi:hypothetical protein